MRKCQCNRWEKFEWASGKIPSHFDKCFAPIERHIVISEPQNNRFATHNLHFARAFIVAFHSLRFSPTDMERWQEFERRICMAYGMPYLQSYSIRCSCYCCWCFLFLLSTSRNSSKVFSILTPSYAAQFHLLLSSHCAVCICMQRVNVFFFFILLLVSHIHALYDF